MIVGVCAGALLIGAMRRRAEWLLNFALRAVLGTLAVFLVNTVLHQAGIDSMIGLNPVTVLTTGTLGFPGLAMLYGIHFYKTL